MAVQEYAWLLLRLIVTSGAAQASWRSAVLRLRKGSPESASEARVWRQPTPLGSIIKSWLYRKTKNLKKIRFLHTHLSFRVGHPASNIHIAAEAYWLILMLDSAYFHSSKKSLLLQLFIREMHVVNQSLC